MQRDRSPVKLFYWILERTLLPPLRRWRVNPSGVTLAGLVVSALAGAAFPVSPPLAALLAVVAGLCDALDGMWARSSGQASSKGAFFDSVLDRYGEACLLIGVWGYLTLKTPFARIGSVAVLAALVGAMMVSYTRARGEGLGVSFDGGHFTRDERLLILVAGGLCDPLAPGLVMLLTVIVLAVGANAAAVYRLWRISDRLAAVNRPARSGEPE